MTFILRTYKGDSIMTTKYVVWTGGAYDVFSCKENAQEVADYWKELGYEDIEIEEIEEGDSDWTII